MKVFICAIALFAATALAAPGVLDNKIESDNSGFSRVAKLFGHCAESDDVTTCLAIKGITALNRAARSNNIELIPGITFTRDQSASTRSGKAISENEIISELPKQAEEKTGRLIDLAMESAVDFFKTHNLQVKVPQEATQEVARAIEEGRGKMKKLMGPLMMAVGAKLIALIPIFLGGLALLAIKAVVVAKIAFVLAIALGASKLFGAGGLSKLGGGLGGGLGSGYNNGGWNNGGWSAGGAGNGAGWSSGASSYPYARSIDDAQDLAYSAQAPAQE